MRSMEPCWRNFPNIVRAAAWRLQPYPADTKRIRPVAKGFIFLVERRQLLQLEDDAEVEVADLLDWENWLHI